MIDRIISFSASHRLLVVTLALAAAILGWLAMRNLPLDVLPDLGERQVIVRTQWDQSPELVEAQVTSPIVASLLGTPGVTAVRGASTFGTSDVYVIFDDKADLYWARQRVAENLAGSLRRLPEGVVPELGPDATSLGWVFQYVLIDKSGKSSLADLRSYQDWTLGYYLRSVQGVAEIASAGGFVRQYQVNVDPNRLRAYGISIRRVADALRNGNLETSGRVLESNGAESIVRGRGYASLVSDINEALVATARDGTPIRVEDVARVSIGSAFRRGVIDLDGEGEAVCGTVVMRHDENVLNVIDRTKAQLSLVRQSLPAGMEIQPVYDRSELILGSIENLKTAILEVMLTVAIVILIFLRHVPSVMVPLVTMPLAILITFIPFRQLGLTMNVLSLAGIAIAIGALVDAGIVIVEQTHKNLEEWHRRGGGEDASPVVLQGIRQVGRASCMTLLVVAVSFLPILTLDGEAGKLFRPLAYTKCLAMLAAAVLAVTLDPALRLLFTRVRKFQFRPAWLSNAANLILIGEIHPEDRHPISRTLIRCYEPVVRWTITHRRVVFASALAMLVATIPAWRRLGTEFLPSIDEGVVLYMPTTMPGISAAEAQKLLQTIDKILKSFPQVDRVLGKAGRAESATDPAPLSMLEVLITLRPVEQWPSESVWYSAWAPEWIKPVLRHITADHITHDELIRRMDQTIRLPGLSNAWTMPVRGRVDMLQTGIRTPLGIKIFGNNPVEIDRIGSRLAELLPSIRGTRGVFSEPSMQGSYVDFVWDRQALLRNGLTMLDAQTAVSQAIGGEDVSTFVSGRERYPISLRYAGDFRQDLQSLKQVFISTEDGQRQIPAEALADIRLNTGPSMIRSEGGLFVGYVYIDSSEEDIEGYVSAADKLIRAQLRLPPGYALKWSGQYESIEAMHRRLIQIVPLTLGLVMALLLWNTRSIASTLIVLLAVPFSLIGAVWLLYALGYHLSAAVWVGLIALLGIDAETGVYMLLYLDQAHQHARTAGKLSDAEELLQAVVGGAARRIRPKVMTVSTMFFGLLPIMWAIGEGSEIMKRIAAPLLGGIFSSFALELLVYPAIYFLWKSRSLPVPVLSLRQLED